MLYDWMEVLLCIWVQSYGLVLGCFLMHEDKGKGVILICRSFRQLTCNLCCMSVSIQHRVVACLPLEASVS